MDLWSLPDGFMTQPISPGSITPRIWALAASSQGMTYQLLVTKSFTRGDQNAWILGGKRVPTANPTIH